MSYAALNTNGTGPFIITSHQAGVRTIFKPNPNWWGKPEHNFDEVIFTTISNDATRVAALLSGDVDWIDPVPLQDIARINASANAQVMQGPELRTIFLGFDQLRAELRYSNVKGKNPFKDVRVRKAFYLAIDENAIADARDARAAVPSALMISPLLFALAKEFKRPAYDLSEAKKLLTEAGYPNGFEVTMDCPNDRYVNDEAICQAVTAMLARVGVKINLNAQPKAKYFAKVLGRRLRHLVLPARLDARLVRQLERARQHVRLPRREGQRRQQQSRRLLQSEGRRADQADPGRDRQQQARPVIKEAYKIGQEQDWGYIPLHQQALAWGVSKKVKLVQRADNQILLYWFRKD